MKKVVSALLIVSIIILSPSAFCEVSLRGGITFQSTKNDIIAFEESQGTKYTIGNATAYGCYADNSIKYEGVEIAGFTDFNRIVYCFDDDDRLSAVLYEFNCAEESRELADKKYDILDNALSKYGDPINDGTLFVEINKEGYDLYDYHLRSNELGLNDTVISLSQRLANAGEDYIDIRIAEFRRGYNNPFYTPAYFVVISYTLCTQEQVQSVFDRAADQSEALINDL